MPTYIYQSTEWTRFVWREELIGPLLGEVRHMQGRILGRMSALGFSLQAQANLETLILDAVGSSGIEGEHLDPDRVRSSIARRLGMDTAGMPPADRYTEGVVDMLLDAVQQHERPLTGERLCAWHAALFPTGRSGLYAIGTGRYRTGEMRIVSGAMGRERVHYEAPPPARVKSEMDSFLTWFNTEGGMDPVLKAAIAHFRFIIIHPFDDGNGRIARALTDMLLARSDGSAQRAYSMSARMLVERKRYYEVLQGEQHSDGDITAWLEWFLGCLKNALLATEDTLRGILRKAEFWRQHHDTPLNERQSTVLNKLLDGFEGKLRSSKWARLAKCSSDTAVRDIKDLIAKGILRQRDEGGRSTSYELVDP